MKRFYADSKKELERKIAMFNAARVYQGNWNLIVADRIYFDENKEAWVAESHTENTIG